ncbi:ribonuclease H family protein [Gardnerella vaginalis]|uniref:ribonuclease H family protein n=1 Tax=Gardnerella vaginalis TaxID=2702 RepID=UPI0039F12201
MRWLQSAAGAFLKGFVMIVVSTDGSALGNPNGSMGWAWADHIDESGSSNEHHHTGNADAGGATNGTNQIGELCAVLEALRAHPGSEPLTIESDSQYAINCATTWIHGWKKNGWKNSKNEPVKNSELIRAIDAEITKREGAVKFVWVKGHAGNAGNEKVDTLARGYAEDCRNGFKDGYLPLEGWKSLLASEYAKGTNVPSDAKMLLDGKISNAEYHLERTVGEDINPDFSAQNSKNDSDLTESTNESAREQTQEAECETAREQACETKRETKRETLENSEKDALSIENKQDAHQQDAVTIVQGVPKTKQNVTQTASKAVQGLSVSGVLQFTPPPNTSPSFNGEARFISGTINVSGYVEPDGTLHLAPTAFYLNQ